MVHGNSRIMKTVRYAFSDRAAESAITVRENNMSFLRRTCLLIRVHTRVYPRAPYATAH